MFMEFCDECRVKYVSNAACLECQEANTPDIPDFGPDVDLDEEFELAFGGQRTGPEYNREKRRYFDSG